MPSMMPSNRHVTRPRWKPGTYTIRLSLAALAIADVCELGNAEVVEEGISDASPLDWYITRINVPRDHRGKGHASAMLKAILHDADIYNTKVWLDISPSDGLGWDALEAWYRRHGFVECPEKQYLYMRKPQNDI